MGNRVNVTVQVIATDTGMILTASKASFVQNNFAQTNSVTTPTPPTSTTGTTNHQPIVTNSNILTETFGNLEVEVTKLQTVKDQYNAYWYQLDLTFHNIDPQNPIAVAMFSDGNSMSPSQLQTFLTSGDGIEYGAYNTELMGINAMRINPLNLTRIDPGELLMTSIKFAKRQDPSPSITKFSLRSTIVVNQNYNAALYDNYQLQNNTLPPNCKTTTLFIDIPAGIIPQNNYAPQYNYNAQNSYTPQNSYVPRNSAYSPPNNLYGSQNSHALPKYYK